MWLHIINKNNTCFVPAEKSSWIVLIETNDSYSETFLLVLVLSVCVFSQHQMVEWLMLQPETHMHSSVSTKKKSKEACVHIISVLDILTCPIAWDKWKWVKDKQIILDTCLNHMLILCAGNHYYVTGQVNFTRHLSSGQIQYSCECRALMMELYWCIHLQTLVELELNWGFVNWIGIDHFEIKMNWN